MEGTKAIVQKYMEDETSCLQEWYRNYYSLEMYPGKPCTVVPNIDEIRRIFAEWFERRRTQLFNLICVEWDYPTKCKDVKFQDKVCLATALADFLIACTLKLPSPVMTTVLLVKMGLDHLCKK